jgi:hypothetical protein
MEISQGNSLCSYIYLKQAKMSGFSFCLFSSTKLESGWWNRFCRGQGVSTSEKEEVAGKGARMMNMVQKMYTHVNVNAKMIPVEMSPEIRGEGIKESSGGGEFNYDIFDRR